MTPYMAFVLPAFIDGLRGFWASSLDDVDYWTGIVETLSKSFAYDEGGERFPRHVLL